MKRRIAALVMLFIMLANVARAEALMAELRSMRKNAGDRILEMESVPTPIPEVAPEPTATPDIHYEPLISGMKGDAVRDMQQRLIDLGYLGGKADGSYGGKTAAAVKAFQQAAGLESTGEADDETQRMLFMTVAPAQKNYEKLDYRRALYEADTYEGALVKFTGTVLQVLENGEYADTQGIYTVMRVATKGDFDNVAYVAWFRAQSAGAILEGDGVSVQGTARGLFRYANEAGDEIVLPRIEADVVE